MKKLFALIALAGCSFPTPSQELACDVTADCDVGRVCLDGFCVVPDDDGPDAGAGSDADAFDCTVFDGRHFRGCDLPEPSEALALSLTGTYVYNTDSGSLTPPSGSMPAPASIVLGGNRVISVESLSIGANAKLRAVGVMPLVVASWSTITVASGATIDVSSSSAEPGAGANPGACTQRAAAVGTSDGDGGAGGGGGGFGAAGGTGGNSGNGSIRLGGTGGLATAPPLLLGGCSGANGGAGQTPGGAGGKGGGAIQLTAKDSITIAGIIHAGGSGGEGGTGGDNDSAAGGGGGGSGGMIGLESAAITIQSGASLAANGGGGGGGSDNAAATRGNDATPNASAAIGGVRQGSGGNGGNGSTTATGSAGQASSAEGAGGGGGGAGIIVFATANGAAPPTTGAVVSPAASAIQR